MAKLEFNAIIKIRNANPYVDVLSSQAVKLKSNWRKPMPLIVRINGLPKEAWKINMMPVGDGNFYLYLHGYIRKASRTNVGDKVKVGIEFDKFYRNGPMHPMPELFRVKLNNNPVAKKNWNDLIPSRKKEILRYFSRLKSIDSINRNVTRAISVLSGKGGRFMARSW